MRKTEKMDELTDCIIYIFGFPKTGKYTLFIPVRMTCSVEEMEKRIIQPERKTRMKQTDPKTPDQYSKTDEVLRINHKNLLELDVSDIPPREPTKKILNHTNSLL